jgi:hypothetical protein
LYVKASAQPTTSVYDCRSWQRGNAETCSFPSPAATTYYIMLDGFAAYTGVNLTASYKTAAPNYSLTIAKSGTGSGTISSSPAGVSCGPTCTQYFAAGSSVTLSATAAPGSTFEGWSAGKCTGKAACAISMNTNQTLTANFRKISSITPILMLLLD